ncbi:unnamed protein product [Brachionus calyciflorus]|uniref:Uncharacterized protein n=1 Tax=Brachionus calyciflorus TaxID=104777 RepID=A0A814J2Q4_9BILA|nr:unnamed protein product [Brachionus calyciflorus]
MNIFIQNYIKNIINEDKDIVPACILDRLINVYNIPVNLIPQLKQVQNFITNLRNRAVNPNSISNVRRFIKDNLNKEK